MFLLLLFFSSSYAADFAELVTNGGGDEEKNSAAFLWKVEIIFNGFQFCSGALVSDTLVLTAGSCLAIFGEEASLDIVLQDGQHATSKETIFHPDYNSTTLYADRGIIRLHQPLQVVDIH